MSLESTLNWTADVVQPTVDNYSQKVYGSALYSGVKTRREESSRFVRDKHGSEVLASHLFFFLCSQVANLEVDWMIRFLSAEYIVVKADRIPDMTADHHWEVWVK